MPHGIVKFFNMSKDYGFITPDDGGADVFLHRRELRRANIVSPPREGDKVTFETEPGKPGKGPKAVKLAVVR